MKVRKEIPWTIKKERKKERARKRYRYVSLNITYNIFSSKIVRKLYDTTPALLNSCEFFIFEVFNFIISTDSDLVSELRIF